VARKGDLKPVLKMNLGLDEPLAAKVKEAAERNERGWNQEVRYALKQFYGIDPVPAEAEAGVSA
jgi:hypothetical protein